MLNRRSTSKTNGHSVDVDDITYEQIMGEEGGHQALSSRLSSFRKWVQNAGCKVHPAVCIVNGEATDGTRNAPVLLLGPPPSTAPVNPISTAEGRCGIVDTDEDRVLYDRTIGCQIRTTREIKEGQILMTVPKTIMVHPDLIAGSDAGRAALACCEPIEDGANFWDVFGHTAAKQETYLNKMASAGGTQLLVKILQERKKVETALAKAAKAAEEGDMKEYKLAPKGVISARAAYMVFLIQQRFSDEEDPKVASDFDFVQISTKDDASKCVERLGLLEGTPESFAPYARTLPPSVALPMCWKRNELATLASCIPGIPLMQEIAAQIMTFSSDLIALVDAGILHRFPTLFSPKLLTWDRWLWAASVHMSRVLPSTCYLNRGESSAKNHVVAQGERFYSPPEVWNDLGVMVPLMDMLNHEVVESQIKWYSPIALDDDDDDDMGMLKGRTDDDNVAKIIIQKRVRKGSQIYTTYDIESNQNLMLQYGFAQMANNADTVQIGWALQDGVGGTSKPNDYVLNSNTEVEEKSHVYETTELEIVNSWWTEDRLSVLKKAMRADQSFWSSLRNGKKMITAANSDGTYEPKLLTAMVVATMSPSAVRKYTNAISTEDERKVTLSRQHQHVLRNYMLFLFTRKLERMLQNVGNGLKAHFNNIALWMKASEGGLDYNSNAGDTNPSESPASNFTGWNSFFDSFAYNAAMEVETRYYSLAPDSCVLTLYDGNLRALQKSINGVISEKSFKEVVVPILKDLDFVISEEDEITEGSQVIVVIESDEKKQDVKTQLSNKSNTEESRKKENNGNSEKKDKEKKKNRQRNNRIKQGGPPAVKLHIGNLSYQTVPNRLYDYFAMRYGGNSVIECHIPTERETGKSRGFGFVTIQEAVAMRILNENLPHEIDGRVLKLAESNTSVQARGSQSSGAANVTSDRCGTCGYRPRYCKCPSPNTLGFQHSGPMAMMGGLPPPGHIHPPSDIYGPGPGGPPALGDMGPYNYGRSGMHPDHGRKRSRSLNRGRSYSRSPSPRYQRRGESRDRLYDRSHRRSRSHSYGRSRSADRARRSRRSRSYDRDSRRSRKSRGSRRSARYSRSNSPGYSKDASSSTRRDRERERKSSASGDDANAQGREDRSRSRSIPPQDRSSEADGSKREGGKSNRRTRSKSRDRNSRSRKRSNKGGRRSKERSKRRSRSLSRSRSRSF